MERILNAKPVPTGVLELNAKDVAALMMLVKVARFANDPTHRDNLVDICGYAALIERCDEAETDDA